MSANAQVQEEVRAPFLVIDEITGEKKEFWMARPAELYCRKKQSRTLLERTRPGSYQGKLETF